MWCWWSWTPDFGAGMKADCVLYIDMIYYGSGRYLYHVN